MRLPLLVPALLLAAGCTGEIQDQDLVPCDDTVEACDPDDREEDLADPEPVPEATPEPEVEAAADDAFGVREIYPTVAGGRSWFLPGNAEQANSQWNPSNGSRGKMVKTGTAEVFRVRGGPRLPVRAPSGVKWFRNVEVTGYYKLREQLSGDEEMSPTGNYGYQLLVRGEMHRTGTIAKNKINNGVAPPAGTKAGPGYPFTGSGSVNAHCVASSYHMNMHTDGRVQFKKEISHTAGYTGGRAVKKPLDGGAMAVNKWYGFKFIVRNRDADTGVHLEAWVDRNADDNWVKVAETDDTGGWNAQSTGVDGCGAAPFKYKKDQVLTWAGPSVLFRFDNVEADVKWFSVREIAALP